MTIRAFSPLQRHGISDPFQQDVIRHINELLQGRLNVTLDVTLTASSTTTTVKDARLSEQSFLAFMPRTVNAAAELGAGGLWISARTAGQATITHANNAQTDRDFTILILG